MTKDWTQLRQPMLRSMRELTVDLHDYHFSDKQAAALALAENILLHLRRNHYGEALNIPICQSARLYIEEIWGYDLDEWGPDTLDS